MSYIGIVQRILELFIFIGALSLIALPFTLLGFIWTPSEWNEVMTKVVLSEGMFVAIGMVSNAIHSEVV